MVVGTSDTLMHASELKNFGSVAKFTTLIIISECHDKPIHGEICLLPQPLCVDGFYINPFTEVIRAGATIRRSAGELYRRQPTELSK